MIFAAMSADLPISRARAEAAPEIFVTRCMSAERKQREGCEGYSPADSFIGHENRRERQRMLAAAVVMKHSGGVHADASR